MVLGWALLAEEPTPVVVRQIRTSGHGTAGPSEGSALVHWPFLNAARSSSLSAYTSSPFSAVTMIGSRYCEGITTPPSVVNSVVVGKISPVQIVVNDLDVLVHQLAGVLVDGRVLLARGDAGHGHDLGVLTGDDRRQLPAALAGVEDALSELVVGRQHAVKVGAVAVVVGDQVLHALLGLLLLPVVRSRPVEGVCPEVTITVSSSIFGWRMSIAPSKNTGALASVGEHRRRARCCTGPLPCTWPCRRAVPGPAARRHGSCRRRCSSRCPCRVDRPVVGDDRDAPAPPRVSTWRASCLPSSAPITSTLAPLVSMLSILLLLRRRRRRAGVGELHVGGVPGIGEAVSNSFLASVQFSRVCAGSATPMRSPGRRVVVWQSPLRRRTLVVVGSSSVVHALRASSDAACRRTAIVRTFLIFVSFCALGVKPLGAVVRGTPTSTVGTAAGLLVAPLAFFVPATCYRRTDKRRAPLLLALAGRRPTASKQHQALDDRDLGLRRRPSATARC